MQFIVNSGFPFQPSSAEGESGANNGGEQDQEEGCRPTSEISALQTHSQNEFQHHVSVHMSELADDGNQTRESSELTPPTTLIEILSYGRTPANEWARMGPGVFTR